MLEKEYPPVLSKADFTRRFKLDEFGNRTLVWDTFEEFADADYTTGLVHLRNRVAGGATHYNQSPNKAEELWRNMPDKLSWYCAAMAPTEHTIFQGEVFRSETGLALYYSTIPKPMRDSLREGGKQVYGLEALLLLKFYLDPVDYDWLEILLDRYDGHVVEFSCYSICCGTLKRRMIVWEVRSY